MTVAVARDEAFNFIYPANLKAFARTIYFSPIHDKELPDADIIYLPGGYPELFVRELEANSAMRHMIKAHADCGKKYWENVEVLFIYAATSMATKCVECFLWRPQWPIAHSL